MAVICRADELLDEPVDELRDQLVDELVDEVAGHIDDQIVRGPPRVIARQLLAALAR